MATAEGPVVVPPGTEASVFAAVVRYASDRARDGGALTPEMRSFLYDLHRAASAAPHAPTSSRGSGVAASDILGAHEVADLLGCSRRWATVLLSSGRLGSRRVGRDWVTTRSDLDRYRFEEPPHGEPGPDAT